MVSLDFWEFCSLLRIDTSGADEHWACNFQWLLEHSTSKY
jgi:hypothetical protein